MAIACRKISLELILCQPTANHFALAPRHRR